MISRGKIIEILRPDPNTGKVFPLLAMEMFGVIRDLIAFKLTGGSKGTVIIDNLSCSECVIVHMNYICWELQLFSWFHSLKMTSHI